MIGAITSNKMTNALVVTTTLTKVHSKYKKRFKAKKKYIVKCNGSENYKIGQQVNFVLSNKPISKTIRWIVSE